MLSRPNTGAIRRTRVLNDPSLGLDRALALRDQHARRITTNNRLICTPVVIDMQVGEGVPEGWLCVPEVGVAAWGGPAVLRVAGLKAGNVLGASAATGSRERTRFRGAGRKRGSLRCHRAGARRSPRTSARSRRRASTSMMRAAVPSEFHMAPGNTSRLERPRAWPWRRTACRDWTGWPAWGRERRRVRCRPARRGRAHGVPRRRGGGPARRQRRGRGRGARRPRVTRRQGRAHGGVRRLHRQRLPYRRE